MDELIKAYLHQLVLDAAHAIAGRFTGFFYRDICTNALITLESGDATDDWALDYVARVTGVDHMVICRTLLDRADNLADEMVARGQRELERSKKLSTARSTVKKPTKRATRKTPRLSASRASTGEAITCDGS